MGNGRRRFRCCEAIGSDLQTFSGWIARTRLLYEDTDQFRSEGDLERVVQGRDPSAGLLLDLARVSTSRRNHRPPGFLAHARDLNPEDPQIHYLFGAIWRSWTFRDAYRSFKKAADMERAERRLQFGRWGGRTQRRLSSESISYLTQYRGQRPRDPRGHLALGAAYYQAGQLAEAQQELRLACASSRRRLQRHTTILAERLCQTVNSSWRLTSWSQRWRLLRKISMQPRSLVWCGSGQGTIISRSRFWSRFSMRIRIITKRT